MPTPSIFTQLGYANQENGDYTDEDVIRTFALDPDKDLNTQMFEKAYKANVNQFLEIGHSQKQAEGLARDLELSAKARYKKQGIKF